MSTVLSYRRMYVVEIGPSCCDCTPAWSAEAPVLARALRRELATGAIPAGTYLVGITASGYLDIRTTAIR